MHVTVASPWDPVRTSDGPCPILHHHLRELASRHELTLLAPVRIGTLPDGVTAGTFKALPCKARACGTQRVTAARGM